MSKVCIYELEDMVCNDLYQCDDHVVPCVDHHSSQCDSHKSLHPGARCTESNAEESPRVRQISPEKAEQENLSANQKSNMLEKETWSKKSCSGLPSCNSESIDEAASSVSDGTKTSSHSFMRNIQSGRSEICVIDSIISDKSPQVINSFDCRRDHISEEDNDLSFFGNNEDEKPVNDLLHYSWADIGNFDDVDRMFRSYDSTFGQGISNDDNLSWVPLSNATGESGNSFKLDSKFSYPESSSLRSIQENDDMSSFSGMSCSINESAMQSSSIMNRGSSWSSVRGESGHLGPLSFSNGSDCSGDKDNIDYFMPNAQINEQNTQLKHQNQPDISENDQYLEDSSIFYLENVAELGKQQADSLESSFGYLQSSTPYMSSEYNGQPDQNSLRMPQSVIKSENSISTSQTSVIVNPENVDMAVQASPCGMIPEKAVPYTSANHIGGEGDVGVSFDLGSSGQYSSVSSGLNDISLEATSFRQLQNAMERLDLRTKLRIRDSLYRLARSAEQRHVNMNGSIDDTDSMSAEQQNKFTGFMDIETETNPIDRSIAHLLFHRPTDSSVFAAGHDSSFKSPAPIHGSSNNSPLIADEFIKREETEAKSER